MNAAALIEELTGLGVHVTRDGDRLYVEPPPGVDLGPFRDRLRNGKHVVLLELVKADILRCVYVEPEVFNRGRYDSLWREYYALEQVKQEGNP